MRLRVDKSVTGKVCSYVCAYVTVVVNSEHIHILQCFTKNVGREEFELSLNVTLRLPDARTSSFSSRCHQ